MGEGWPGVNTEAGSGRAWGRLCAKSFGGTTNEAPCPSHGPQTDEKGGAAAGGGPWRREPRHTQRKGECRTDVNRKGQAQTRTPLRELSGGVQRANRRQ